MGNRVEVVLLRTNRSYYSKEECANDTITVGELISELQYYDSDAPIMFSNDGGYTYGYISERSIKNSSYIEGEDD
jgi:hypothetical protein